MDFSPPEPDPLDQPMVLGRVVGRYLLDVDRARLVIQVRDAHAASIHGCLFTVFAASCSLAMGIMALISQRRFDSGSWSFVVPQKNHLGFLWLFSTLALAFVLPFWMRRLHGVARQIVASRTDRTLWAGSQRIPLRKVESILLQERHDPDGALMVRMLVSHHDGMEAMVLEDYDELAVRTLAAELARFLGCPVRWTA